MKLIIQIPCYNEEQTLPVTLQALPRQVPRVDQVEWLVIDDGSTDQTAKTAREYGVDHIVNFKTNRGLARAFMAGLEACVKNGADIIVNTDADNQYNAADIPKLIEPILNHKAEIVVGARPIETIEHFSMLKKRLQRLGSWVVRRASQTTVTDSPSGFRAISREAAMRLYVFNEYTYTLETVIQAGQKGIPIVSVPVRTNLELRPSRLVKSVFSYVRHAMVTIFRIFIIYCPARFFFWLGLVPFLVGVGLVARWMVLYLIELVQYQPNEPLRARAPSLILAAILILVSFQMWLFGLLADLLAATRNLVEDVQYRVRRLEVERTDQERVMDE